jgi:hypothetical protein
MSSLSGGYRKGSYALAVLFTLSATSAKCEDYPYAGLFWPAWEQGDSDQLESQCAPSFVEQRRDGNWFVYHVDLDEFEKSRSVQYKQLANGFCKYDGVTKVESCVTFIDKSFAEGEGATTYDVVVAIGESKVETKFSQDRIEMDSELRSPEGLKSGITQNFLRCPYAEETLLSLKVEGITELSAEAINALRFPSEEFLSAPIVDLLVAALRRN